MDQEALFVEDIYQALSDAIRAIGGPKAVAHELWPDKPIDKAANLLNDCLNRNRSEKLDPEQVIYIIKASKKAGCHVPMKFIADECEYDNPKPITPEEQMNDLQLLFVEKVSELQKIEKQLKGLMGG